MKANAIPIVEDQDLADADGNAIEVASGYKKIGKAVDNAIRDEGERKERKKCGAKGKAKRRSR